MQCNSVGGKGAGQKGLLQARHMVGEHTCECPTSRRSPATFRPSFAAHIARRGFASPPPRSHGRFRFCHSSRTPPRCRASLARNLFCRFDNDDTLPATSMYIVFCHPRPSRRPRLVCTCADISRRLAWNSSQLTALSQSSSTSHIMSSISMRLLRCPRRLKSS